MNIPAITAEHITKRYHLGQISNGYRSYKTLRDTISNAIKNPFARILSPNPKSATAAKEYSPVIDAVKDVSIKISEGEIVGIVGRNGSGKSTLLKILSRITAPTEGRATISGRIGSLLEVGTGFHPELTGRENIYLNGAILGMKKKEIDRKFDEIVSFAETEAFLDTPVKRYSSGMYLRLAIAVAANLETEILLVDEVLAVGDAAFQKKCLNKMNDIGKTGRTILFVSHNMSAILRLCTRAILLNKGQLVDDGVPQEVVGSYMRAGLGSNGFREWTDQSSAPGNEVARLRSARIRDVDGHTVDSMDIRQSVGIEMKYEVLASNQVLVPNFHVYNEEGACIFITHDHDAKWFRKPRPAGTYTSTAWIPENYLAEGTFSIGVALSTMVPLRVHLHIADAIMFQVLDGGDGDSARGDYTGHIPGAVRPLLAWSTEFTPASSPT